LVAILPHYLTTSGCHPRPQFHELYPQVLQGALVVGDLTLDIRQLEFKEPDFIFRRHWRPRMPEPVWPKPPAAPQPQGRVKSDGRRTRINNGPPGKRGELPPENPDSPVGFLSQGNMAGRGVSVPRSHRRCRPQACRFNPASFSFGFAGRGQLLILPFKLTLRLGRYRS
jgi:hypothetical protein